MGTTFFVPFSLPVELRDNLGARRICSRITEYMVRNEIDVSDKWSVCRQKYHT